MFKIGDKVKCVDRGDNLWLTQGKEYEVVDITNRHPLPNMIRVIADDRLSQGYYATRFELVQEVPTARANDPATSKGKRKVNKYEQAVLTYLGRTAGGATGKDLAGWSGHPLNCITPRFAPLRRKGLIKPWQVLVNGEYTTIKRDKQIVWVLA
jgi:hypothetical protein